MVPQKLMIAFFAILTIIFAIIIFILFRKDKQAIYDMYVNAKVEEIYKVRGRPTQRSIRLDDHKVLDVPEEFLPYVQVGDSILKESNSSQIMLITFQQNSRTVIIHP